MLKSVLHRRIQVLESVLEEVLTALEEDTAAVSANIPGVRRLIEERLGRALPKERQGVNVRIELSRGDGRPLVQVDWPDALVWGYHELDREVKSEEKRLEGFFYVPIITGQPGAWYLRGHGKHGGSAEELRS